MADRDELHAKWKAWVQSNVSTDAQAVENATKAALEALDNGGDVSQAVQAAHRAAMKTASTGSKTERPVDFDEVAVRLKWSQWAEREIVGDAATRKAATEAAVHALSHGATVEDAIRAAQRSVLPPPAGVIRGRVSQVRQRYEGSGNSNDYLDNEITTF
jgi:hypothetical protein